MAAEQHPTKLEHILADETLAVTFRNFLHKTACGENLSFWLEVELLKELDENEQRSILTSVAQKVFEKYFSPSSEYEVNVDQEIKHNLQKQMATPTIHSFDVAQDYARYLLESDCMPKFTRSDMYRNFLEERKKNPRIEAEDPSASRFHLTKFLRLFGIKNAPEPRKLRYDRAGTLMLMSDWRQFRDSGDDETNVKSTGKKDKSPGRKDKSPSKRDKSPNVRDKNAQTQEAKTTEVNTVQTKSDVHKTEAKMETKPPPEAKDGKSLLAVPNTSRSPSTSPAGSHASSPTTSPRPRAPSLDVPNRTAALRRSGDATLLPALVAMARDSNDPNNPVAVRKTSEGSKCSRYPSSPPFVAVNAPQSNSTSSPHTASSLTSSPTASPTASPSSSSSALVSSVPVTTQEQPKSPKKASERAPATEEPQDPNKPPVSTRPKPLSRHKREQLEAAAKAEKEEAAAQKTAVEQAKAAEAEVSLSDSLKARLAALVMKDKQQEEKEAAVKTKREKRIARAEQQAKRDHPAVAELELADTDEEAPPPVLSPRRVVGLVRSLSTRLQRPDGEKEGREGVGEREDKADEASGRKDTAKIPRSPSSSQLKPPSESPSIARHSSDKKIEPPKDKSADATPEESRSRGMSDRFKQSIRSTLGLDDSKDKDKKEESNRDSKREEKGDERRERKEKKHKEERKEAEEGSAINAPVDASAKGKVAEESNPLSPRRILGSVSSFVWRRDKAAAETTEGGGSNVAKPSATATTDAPAPAAPTATPPLPGSPDSQQQQDADHSQPPRPPSFLAKPSATEAK